MPENSLGWAIIIGVSLFVVGSCNSNRSTAPTEAAPDTTYMPTSDKPIKVGDTTYKNEKELVDSVCKATPGLKGCP